MQLMDLQTECRQSLTMHCSDFDRARFRSISIVYKTLFERIRCENIAAVQSRDIDKRYQSQLSTATTIKGPTCIH